MKHEGFVPNELIRVQFQQQNENEADVSSASPSSERWKFDPSQLASCKILLQCGLRLR